MKLNLSVRVSPTTHQTLRESPMGPDAAVDAAVEHWVSCDCKSNIRQGILQVCDYCKMLDQQNSQKT